MPVFGARGPACGAPAAPPFPSFKQRLPHPRTSLPVFFVPYYNGMSVSSFLKNFFRNHCQSFWIDSLKRLRREDLFLSSFLYFSHHRFRWIDILHSFDHMMDPRSCMIGKLYQPRILRYSLT